MIITGWNVGVSSGVAACRSGLSKLVGPEDLGKLNSLLGIVQNATTLLSGVVFNNIYQHTVRFSPSITLYVIAGVALVLPVSLTLLLKTFERRIVRRIAAKDAYEEIVE